MVHYSFFEMIQILDHNGTVKYVAPYDFDYIDINLSEQPFYKETLKTGRIYWSETFISTPTGFPTITVTFPLSSGMIVCYLNLAELSRIVEETSIGKSGYAVITDIEGTIIAHPDTTFVFERVNIRNLSIIENALKKMEGSFRFLFQDADNIGSVSAVGSTGWPVVIVQSAEEAFAPVRRVRLIFLSGIGVALVLAFIFSQFSTGRINISLSQLMKNARKIADGEYSVSMHVESYIEIEELARDFTSMAEAIEAREEEIRRVNSFLDSIVENIPNMVFVKDAGDLKFVRFNRAGEDLLGYSRESLIGKNDYDFFPKEEADFFISKDREVLEKGNLVDIPAEMIKTKDKGERILHTKKIPIFDENKEPLYLLGISEDITDIKRMEEELLNARKLESIGILAGGIAHDFNNILTAILGNVELAKMYTGQEGKILERLAQAEKAASRAKDLTQQLLTFSKGGVPVKNLTSMTELLKETAAFALSGSNVTCEFKISDRLFPAVVDEGQMSQVINNLIINADQSMPEGGKITVSAENVIIGSERRRDSGAEHKKSDESLQLQEGNYIKIIIRDDGKGIPEEDLPRIFDPYFTTKEEGSGLGLASAYSIIKRHGGHITVKSCVGHGTAFTIHLPARGGDLPSGTISEKQKFHTKGRALIMDNEESVRNVLLAMLESTGYEVRQTGDGTEAVELYTEAKGLNLPFDVVIMDLTVPGGMGGKEAVKILLDIDPEAKVIVSSGYSNDPVMADYKSFGFSGAVSKPFKQKDLIKTLKEVAGGE